MRKLHCSLSHLPGQIIQFWPHGIVGVIYGLYVCVWVILRSLLSTLSTSRCRSWTLSFYLSSSFFLFLQMIFVPFISLLFFFRHEHFRSISLLFFHKFQRFNFFTYTKINCNYCKIVCVIVIFLSFFLKKTRVSFCSNLTVPMIKVYRKKWLFSSLSFAFFSSLNRKH